MGLLTVASDPTKTRNPAGFQNAGDVWREFQRIVIDPGNCTHCGACAGLNSDLLHMQETPGGPLPALRREPRQEDFVSLRAAYAICTGRGVPYPELFEYLQQKNPNPLLGPYAALYTGYAADEAIRRRGASGGVISCVLIHLLETGRIDGAVVLQQGRVDPERATPFIATTKEEILTAAQSVYAVTPTLDILPEMERFNGRLAFVGLPEQVTALRLLQAARHPAAAKVDFIAGPYVGTNMYSGAIRSFLRSQGVPDDVKIRSIQWRAGEWPGHLRVETVDGGVFQAQKFYYNYLIPFFISTNCLLTPDFANETTDISVGDAWSPALERAGGGHSVVVPRNEPTHRLLQSMRSAGKIVLTEITFEQALAMHAHMIEFKKRGSAIRLDRRQPRPVPEYGYRPAEISLLRRGVEFMIGLFLWVGRQPWARWLVRQIPLSIVGPVFNVIRKSWKSISKPIKRKGLATLSFVTARNPARWREVLAAFDRP